MPIPVEDDGWGDEIFPPPVPWVEEFEDAEWNITFLMICSRCRTEYGEISVICPCYAVGNWPTAGRLKFIFIEPTDLNPEARPRNYFTLASGDNVCCSKCGIYLGTVQRFHTRKLVIVFPRIKLGKIAFNEANQSFIDSQIFFLKNRIAVA